MRPESPAPSADERCETFHLYDLLEAPSSFVSTSLRFVLPTCERKHAASQQQTRTQTKQNQQIITRERERESASPSVQQRTIVERAWSCQWLHLARAPDQRDSGSRTVTKRRGTMLTPLFIFHKQTVTKSGFSFHASFVHRRQVHTLNAVSRSGAGRRARGSTTEEERLLH